MTIYAEVNNHLLAKIAGKGYCRERGKGQSRREEAVSDDLEDRVTQAVNKQKGESLALTTLLMAILRVLSPEQRAAALREFDTECEAARAVLLHSQSEDLIQGFETAVGAVNGGRPASISYAKAPTA